MLRKQIRPNLWSKFKMNKYKREERKNGQQTNKKKIFVLVPSTNNDIRNIAYKYLCRTNTKQEKCGRLH